MGERLFHGAGEILMGGDYVIKFPPGGYFTGDTI